MHFGSKEGLFEAAVEQVLGQIGAEVDLTEDDLPGFAGRRFDQLQQHPEAIRINLWRFLERPSAGPDGSRLYSAKVKALAASHSTPESARPVPAADLTSPADSVFADRRPATPGTYVDPFDCDVIAKLRARAAS